MDAEPPGPITPESLRLLGDLFLDGFQPDRLDAARRIPALAAHLPDGQAALSDDWAAEHYRLFGREVPPYAGIFLTVDGMLGGWTADLALAFFNRAGFDPGSSGEAPDHLGRAFHFLAGRAADLEDPLTQAFLGEFLLPWLPGFTRAVRAQRNDFYAALAGCALDHAQQLLSDRARPEVSLAAFPDDLLDRPETGLRDIARMLLTPAYSGIYLSVGDIRRLGRDLRLPHGFGSRVQLLHNLFRSALTYSTFPEVLQRLEAVIRSWETFYQELEEKDERLARISGFWRMRLQESLAAVRRIRSEPP